MLRASHFPALSRQMENDFVMGRLNFVETSRVKSAHGLAMGLPQANPIRQQSEPFGSGRASKTGEGRGRKCRKARGQRAARSGHENEGQEARAEQDQTGCGQGQETVGDRIMMAHVTSSFSEARPN
jgi:hypothetical protein